MLINPRELELYLYSLVLFTKICLYSLKCIHSTKYKDQPKHDWIKKFQRIVQCWYYSTIPEAYRLSSHYKFTCIVWMSIMNVHIKSAQLVGFPSMTVLGLSIHIRWNPSFLCYQAVTCWLPSLIFFNSCIISLYTLDKSSSWDFVPSR